MNNHQNEKAESINNQVAADIIGEEMCEIMTKEINSDAWYPGVQQVTRSRLDKMREHQAAGKYYGDIQVLSVLGRQVLTNIPKWLEIGKKNHWIKSAYDPAFDENSFAECKTITYLIDQFKHANWSLGTAFYYKNICFINQDEGGDEWRVIRDGMDFESMSCGRIVERDGNEVFIDILNRMLNASDEQLITLDYMKAGPTCFCAHCGNIQYLGSSKMYQSTLGDTCESCWTSCDKKLYINGIVNKVCEKGERLMKEDLQFVQYRDKFCIAGTPDLSGGWFIHWDESWAIGISMDNDKITVYKFNNGGWIQVEDYYVRG